MDAMRGRGIHGSGFHAPFYFRFEAWKPTANGRTKVSKPSRRSPRLGFPLWNPSSEAPPFQGIPKGGNPSFSTEILEARWSLFWGKGANHCVVCPSGHVLCSWLFSPHRRPTEGRGGPQRPDGAGHWGKGHAEALDFRARKITGLKAKGLVIFPLPAHATKPPTFRFTPSDLWPHPPPRWAPTSGQNFN